MKKPGKIPSSVSHLVRHVLKTEGVLQATKAARRWLVATGRGDSFERAKRIVKDVAAKEPWTLRNPFESWSPKDHKAMLKHYRRLRKPYATEGGDPSTSAYSPANAKSLVELIWKSKKSGKNPGGKHLRGVTAKFQRQYEHVLKSLKKSKRYSRYGIKRLKEIAARTTMKAWGRR